MAELVEDVAAVGVESVLPALTRVAEQAIAAGAGPGPAATTGIKIKGKKVVKVPKVVKAEEAAPAEAEAQAKKRPTSDDDLTSDEKKERKKFARAKLPKTITAFWRMRDKYPQYFPLTSTGDAATSLIFDKKGSPLKVIDGPPDKLFDLSMYI